VAWPASAAATRDSAGVYCAGVLQGLVDRSGQVGYVVVAGRAVDRDGDDDAGVGEVQVQDPVAVGLALVIPDRSGQAAGLLRDAEAVAGRVGEGGAGDGLAGGFGYQGFELVLLAGRQELSGPPSMATAASGPAGLAMERRMLQGINARAEIRRSVPEAARTREPPCPCPSRIPSSWSCTPAQIRASSALIAWSRFPRRSAAMRAAPGSNADRAA